ncbi:hypothetical protein J5N97_027672 [Dioscorea zingiberensis]|uniref:Uncharacterized protein n=1 Tax=Dioscorea zingiberensis TaxID=325984 RepID=A0A9D5H402_9LILI|nr:hypothetical protein J5N97_027672 [Dioscorea zingiberensis]
MAEAAALAVTGWLVTPLISKLVLKGLSMFEDGMKGKLENLQNITVPQIKQVIEKAEMLVKEDDKQLMTVWLRKLQDAAYEADNVLDEYDYELLERQAKGKFTKAVVNPPLSFLSDASFRSKLKDSLEKLDKIASRVHTFTNMLGGVSNASSLDDETTFVTGSVPTEPHVFGRDAERDRILDLLINNHAVAAESNNENRDVPVLPIVGVGGVGKTTLAQHVYNKIASLVGNFTNMLLHLFMRPRIALEWRIFGRDRERDDILDLLINNHVVASESDHETRDHVLVLPIVGVGGVGKTTLAQDIYNNPKIIDHFPTRMWIHTPQNLDEIIITRRMVESVHRDARPSIDNFAMLQQSLLEGLHEKRFLLVLDDVWYDEKESEFVNRERWRKLLAPLRHGGQGSMVLITSRIDLVAMTFCNTLQPIRLEGLNEHDCLSLFNSYAFDAAVAAAAASGQQRPDDQHEHHLMEIGRKIARKIVSKLGGLPLAAKVLGGMLRNKHDVEEWNKVLRIDIWDDITRVLALSYKRLPPLLRQCVAHHGLYPKDLSFSDDFLVRSWIAEGFISAAQHDEQETGKSMEEIGSNCLNELVFRSFFQRTNDGRFLLHDLMHDVADSVSRHECIRIQKGEKKDIRPTTKHLCIHVEDLDEHYKENICRLRNLRTLLLLCNSESEFTLDHGVLHSLLNKSKRLRTLYLVGLRIDKLPDSIGDLKHLRFLELYGSTVKTLPKSFHRLYHLLYLDLSGCKFDSVPKGLSELVNLRHLEADGTTLSMIRNLGRLTALQELKEFHVKKEKGHEAGQLKNLANLRATIRVVNLENISSTSEASEAKLHDKTQLKQVWLEWDERNTSNTDSAEMVLDGFQPPPHIIFLGVKHYFGSRAPIWMQPNLLCGSSLHTLILENCVKLRSLPPLGQLFPHLRELRLKCCYLIRYLPYLPPNLITLELFYPLSLALLTEEELSSDGPQLELEQVLLEKSELFNGDSVTDSLELNLHRFVNVEEIMSWLEIANPYHNPSGTVLFNIMNFILLLKIGGLLEKWKMPLDAGNVQQLPSSLQHLDLSGISVDDATLSECLSRLHSLTSLMLNECMCIITLPSKEVLSNLRRLQTVSIFSCKMLVSLGCLAALASLEKLTISECPNLMTMVPCDDHHDQSNGAVLLPESLTDLVIQDCGFLDTYMGRWLMGLTRLSQLALSKCKHMTSLPTAEQLMHLTSLQSLVIEDCELLVSVGGLHVLFSSLQILTVLECPGLFTLKSTADQVCMFCLSVDNLSLLPALLSRKGLESLRHLALVGRSQNTALTSEQEEWFQHLPSLHILVFLMCERLPSLPSNLTNLTRLKELYIEDCPQVSSLPTLPISLEYLKIERCHPELEQRCREGGPDWDLIKHIPDRFII